MSGYEPDSAMALLLIVDDDKDDREVLCRFLQSKGHHVECASNGKEALGVVIGQTPDLVILNLFMPEVDGGGFWKSSGRTFGCNRCPLSC